MAKYRKLPVVIEAFQMTKERRWDDSSWPEWLRLAWSRKPSEGALWPNPYDPLGEKLDCGTLKGILRISWNDFIIQDVDGKIYPCNPDIFKKTYELVE